jgi:hypothetical protein
MSYCEGLKIVKDTTIQYSTATDGDSPPTVSYDIFLYVTGSSSRRTTGLDFSSALSSVPRMSGEMSPRTIAKLGPELQAIAAP